MTDSAADKAASLPRAIWQARQDGSLLPRDTVKDVVGRDAAYAVQMAATDAAGLTRAGWKIAATSAIAQELIGVDGPSLGPVFAEHIFEPGATCVARPNQGMAIECEIAFVMAGDCDFGVSPARDAVLAATKTARIGIEVVGCRFEGGVAAAGPAILISDFSFNVALVRGPEIRGWRDMDLSAVEACAVVNGERGNTGTGAAVMGDPVAALVWAAGEAARIGRPLKAGDIIKTGTMTGVVPVKPGDEVVGDFSALGSVQVNFAPD